MKNLKVLFTVLCVAYATTVWGAEDEITLANGTGSGSGTSYQITWSGISCTITQTKASSSTSVNSSYIAAPRWYQGHKIVFTSKTGYDITGATIVCTSNTYATALKNSTYSTGTSATVSSQTVTITASGDFTITMGAQSRISSVTVIYTSGSGETTHYNVQWMVDGQPYTTGNPTTSVASGSKVSTLPTDPADDRLSCAEKFMGWSAQHIGTKPQDDAPADLFTTIDTSPFITQDTTFYAVFATPQ